jgi:hypothetical protein
MVMDADQEGMKLMNRICEIQGRELTSPFVGNEVFHIPGIVTAVANSETKFFMEDPNGCDHDVDTSDGIEVWNIEPPNTSLLRPRGTFNSVVVNLAVGDMVVIAMAIVGEQKFDTLAQPTTYLVAAVANIEITSRTNALPDPVVIGVHGRSPPTENMEAGVMFWESLEGMRVEIKNPIAISATEGTGDDQKIYMVADNGHFATGLSMRGTLSASPHDFNPERLLIDEENIFDFTFPRSNVGTMFGDIIGIVDDVQDFRTYEIIPTHQFGFVEQSQLLPTNSSCKKGQYSMSVGTYNLEGIGGPPFRYDIIAEHIGVNMGFPDVVGLQGVPATFNVVELISQIETAAGVSAPNDYELLRKPVVGPELVVLYNQWRISVENDGGIQDQAGVASFFSGVTPPYFVRFKFLPLEMDFDFLNVVFTNDKEDSAASAGVNQPFETLQEADRINAGVDARRMQSLGLRELILGEGNTANKIIDDTATLIVVGSFYENEWVSPITNIEGAGLKPLVDDIAENERYSTIFDGNSQAW